MMAAGGVPLLGGYDYDFIDELPSDWECLVCQLPLKNPVQIEKCGHRLCEICVATILRYVGVSFRIPTHLFTCLLLFEND